MGSKLIGRRKLSRQFVIMIITIQVLVVLLFCILIRIGSIQIFLTAKQDALSTDLNEDRDELYSMNEFPWAFEYWIDHYDEIVAEKNTRVDSLLIENEFIRWNTFARALPSNTEEAAVILN